MSPIGGFVIPNNPNHAWEMVNETYLGPVGWILSLTAAPRGSFSVSRHAFHAFTDPPPFSSLSYLGIPGSVSAGMWSTICTRVALLVTARLQEAIVAATTILSSRSSATSSSPQGVKEKEETSNNEKSETIPASKASSKVPTSEKLRKRTAGAKADL